jgi:hypothetical protein
MYFLNRRRDILWRIMVRQSILKNLTVKKIEQLARTIWVMGPKLFVKRNCSYCLFIKPLRSY